MHYENTQRGYLLTLTLGIIMLALIFLAVSFPQLFLVVGLLALALVSFATLKTIVDDTHLTIVFGIGLIKKKFPLNEIESVLVVKNRWYYGWGIHFLLYPRMWVFNVSGFKAIELQMKNKKRYRIGTNKPEELRKQIHQRIKVKTF